MMENGVKHCLCHDNGHYYESRGQLCCSFNTVVCFLSWYVPLVQARARGHRPVFSYCWLRTWIRLAYYTHLESYMLLGIGKRCAPRLASPKIWKSPRLISRKFSSKVTKTEYQGDGQALRNSEHIRTVMKRFCIMWLEWFIKNGS